MLEHRHIYSVSEINENIKAILETKFSIVWISGEVSNFRKPGASNHYYFTLKDAHSQISTVMFRSQIRNLKFDLEDGLSIIGLGRISVYEPRGTYQIILEYLEPKGIGALQIAFEQLKTKLAAEGLFDSSRKKELPFLPKKICLITSPTGAVLHDILNVARRRFASIPIEIIPVKVQGENSIQEIEKALQLINDRRTSDVIILARGGGSIEDMMAFNSESVAMAIFASKIPVISAIGHETDFTISDFVADLRAPTPSAAAELVIPSRDELIRRCSEINLRLTSVTYYHIEKLRSTFSEILNRLIHPRQRIQDSRLALDDLTGRLTRHILTKLLQNHDVLTLRLNSLQQVSPLIKIQKLNLKMKQYDQDSLNFLKLYLSKISSRFREITGKLTTLNPLAILSMGYSITRTIPEKTVVRNPGDVRIRQNLEILLARGSLICRVERIKDVKTDI